MRVAVAQLATLLTDERLPFHNALCVQVDDSRYSTPAFLHPVAQHANLVTIARLRGTPHAVSPSGAGRRDHQAGGACPGEIARRSPAPANNLGPAGAKRREHPHKSAAGFTRCRSKPGLTC